MDWMNAKSVPCKGLLTYWGQDKITVIFLYIFKFILVYENCCILIQISLKFLFVENVVFTKDQKFQLVNLGFCVLKHFVS